MHVSDQQPTTAFVLTYIGVGTLAICVPAVVFAGTTSPPNHVWLLFATLFVFALLRQGCVVFHAATRRNYRLSRSRAAPQPPPSICIVIPCLNEEAALTRTLPANAAIHYEGQLNLLYVVEPNSTDGTAELVQNVAMTEPRVRLYRKPTPASGHGNALDVGFMQTDADILGFIDADHTMSTDSLAAVAAYFAHNPNLHALRGRCIAGAAQGWLAQLLSWEWDWYEATEIPFHEFVRGFTFLGGGHGFLRGQTVRANRILYGAAILDDIDLSLRLHEAGIPILLAPDVQTGQEYPDTLCTLFQQRRRWARGWWQLSRKHFRIIACTGNIRVRLDALQVLLVPLFCPTLLFATVAAVFAFPWGMNTASISLVALAVAGMMLSPLVHGRVFCHPWSTRRSLTLSVALFALWFFYSVLFSMAALEAMLPGTRLTYYKTRKGVS